MSGQEIAAKLPGLSYANARQALHRLAGQGIVYSPDRGLYAYQQQPELKAV